MNNTRSGLKDFSYKCQECGQYHSSKPTFEDVKTSIDSIHLLLEKLRQRERLEQVII